VLIKKRRVKKGMDVRKKEERKKGEKEGAREGIPRKNLK